MVIVVTWKFMSLLLKPWDQYSTNELAIQVSKLLCLIWRISVASIIDQKSLWMKVNSMKKTSNFYNKFVPSEINPKALLDFARWQNFSKKSLYCPKKCPWESFTLFSTWCSFFHCSNPSLTLWTLFMTLYMTQNVDL